jgi:hypothetical protein
MKQVFTFLLILCAAAAGAQDTLSNSGFNYWHGGVFAPAPGGGFGCCGIALAVPDQWGIPEQLMAMPTNHFTYKETDTAYIHSGFSSAKLATNITQIDSAGAWATGATVLVPGSVTCAGIVGYGSLGIMGDPYKTIAYSTGQAFSDTPRGITFYMLMEHDVADTAHYAYVFTRWDSIAWQEDTIAYHEVDIPDNGLPYDQWMRFSDDINYILPGLPDTLHLIFYGGRNGDSTKAGNVTWLDDISFYHSGDSLSAGIVHLDMDDAISVYPNPTASILHVSINDYMTGYAIELYDLSGRRVMHEVLMSARTSFSISSLTDGVYLYRVLDRGSSQVMSGKVTIDK